MSQAIILQMTPLYKSRLQKEFRSFAENVGVSETNRWAEQEWSGHRIESVVTMWQLSV